MDGPHLDDLNDLIRQNATVLVKCPKHGIKFVAPADLVTRWRRSPDTAWHDLVFKCRRCGQAGEVTISLPNRP